MHVEVRLFAGLRETLNKESLSLEVPDGSTEGTLRKALEDTFPDLAPWLGVCRMAQGVEFLQTDSPIEVGEPVALIPPVSGGSPEPSVRLTLDALDPRKIEAEVSWDRNGAICTFQGTVRSPNAGRDVQYLDYEAHEPMALAQMQKIVDETEAKWEGSLVRLVHRLGRVDPGVPSVVIVVSCPHRAASFEACRYVIERLKEDVPIWKKEVFSDGSSWVGLAKSSGVGNDPLPPQS